MRADNYTRDQVEDLLYLLWDPEWTYGPGANPTEPDGDMPRGSHDPSKSGGWMAAHADVSNAWGKARLGYSEARRLGMYFGMGLTQQQIGYRDNASQQAVSKSLESGIEKIVAAINGRV